MANIKPWPFDILTRVTNVRQTGSFVAAGLSYATGRGVIMRGEGEQWNVIETIAEGDASQFNGLACGTVDGKTVYVAGGTSAVRNPGRGKYGGSQLIYTSTNGGKSWSQSRSKEGGFVYVMAWDSRTKHFYAQAVADLTAPSTGEIPSSTLEVLASSDGSSWGTVEGREQVGFETYASPYLTDTGTPLLKDGNENIVPNGGFAGWSGSPGERTSIVAPTDLGCYGQQFLSPGANTVRIIEDEDAEETVSLPMEHVQCVALAGGVYAAAGNNAMETSVIAISADGGKTWEQVYSSAENMIFSIVGTPT